MSSYVLTFPEIGEVKISKKRGMRSIRMRISPKGDVLVSAPLTTPKYFIANFIQARTSWVVENLPPKTPAFCSGQYFGDGIQLILSTGLKKNRSFITPTTLRISLAEDYNPNNPKQNEYIEKKILSVMHTRAEHTLLPRLEELARATGHDFHQASIKTLVSRWGSCDSHKNIILNVYLLQVPQKLQDYVMLHELTHTVHMNHGDQFWQHMAELMPSYKLFRKMLKSYQTAITLKTERES